jgi:DNA-binding LytR/AlgR family response regulator
MVMPPLILCVDDDSNVLASLSRSLQHDFIVHTASSGLEALPLLEQGGNYAAILADMRMPQMDGLEFLAQASRSAPTTVAAMLTGDGDQETAINALNAGTVHRFIRKPASIEEIKETLLACCRLHEQLLGGDQTAELLRLRTGLAVGSDQEQWLQRIPVRHGERMLFIEVENICWIEAASNYVLVHTDEIREIVRETLGAFERKLNTEQFVRISRSAIVRLSAVQEIRTDGRQKHSVVLKTGEELFLTRSVKQLRQRIEATSNRLIVSGAKRQRTSAVYG